MGRIRANVDQEPGPGQPTMLPQNQVLPPATMEVGAATAPTYSTLPELRRAQQG